MLVYVSLFIQHHKYTNEFTEQMHGFVCTTITRRSTTTKQEKQGTSVNWKRREKSQSSALVRLSPYQLHTTPCSDLEEQNRKTLLLLEAGGLSIGGRWSPLLLDRESGLQYFSV